MTNTNLENQNQDAIQLDQFKNAIDKYIAKNFIVIPCNNKIPILKNWSQIEEQDPEEIFNYFKNGKANQIGIRTDDVFVVDVDYDTTKQVDGYNSLRQLQQIIPDDFSNTLQAKTPRGGKHFYFKKPEDIEIKNTTNLAEGVDIRGSGGFVVAYPSKGYEFIDNTKQASMPSKKLVDLIHGNVKPLIQNKSKSEIKSNDIIGKISDGREALMQKIVYKHFAELKKQNRLNFENLYNKSAEEYFAKAESKDPSKSLEAEGRGETELRKKCDYLIGRFEKGRIDLETVEKINSDLESLKAYPSSFLMQQQAPDREWAWESWHMKKTVANIYGIGGIGKSTFLLSLANHVSLGREFCSSKTAPMKTLCIFCEEDINEIARRQQQVQMGFGYMTNNENLLISPRVGFDNIMVYYDQSGLPQKGKFFYQLYDFITEHKIEYLILDTLSDIFGGSEIIRSHVNYFMKAILGQLINELGVTILISGHPSISGQSGHKFSGSTAWQGATRSLWYMDKNEEDGSRELCRLKSNYSESGKDVKIILDYSDGVFKQRIGFIR
jgi:hypothetical protein